MNGAIDGEGQATGSVAEILRLAAKRLQPVAAPSERLEAEMLVAHALGRPRTYLHAWPDAALGDDQRRACMALVERRARGEPVAYLVGRRAFWSLELAVTPDTLIPRPDTETLVEQALRLIHPGARLRVADLGTGSGAIAAALAHERPDCRIVATDVSPAALAVARENFRRLGLANVAVFQGAWCRALPAGERFDLVVSNPPYIPAGDVHLTRGDLPWEPRDALSPGPEGLESLRRIAAETPEHLAPGGHLLLEHGFDQGGRVRDLLGSAGFREIQTHRDIEGRERVTGGRRP